MNCDTNHLPKGKARQTAQDVSEGDVTLVGQPLVQRQELGERKKSAGDCPTMPINVDDYDDTESRYGSHSERAASEHSFEGTSRVVVTSPPATLLTVSENDACDDLPGNESDNSEWRPPSASKRRRILRRISSSPPAPHRSHKDTKKAGHSMPVGILEVYIQRPPGFDESKYISKVPEPPEPEPEVIRNTGSKNRMALPSGSSKDITVKSPKGKQRRRASGRKRVRKGKKDDTKIPGVAWLCSYFPAISEDPGPQDAGPSRVTIDDMIDDSQTPVRETPRTRSPSTYPIDIDEELLWQDVESSNDERDGERVEHYLLHDEYHPSSVPVRMAPQGIYGLHPRHMQHFSDWSQENLGGSYTYQNHSLMDEDLKAVFSTMNHRIFNDDREAIESFKRRKRQNKPSRWGRKRG